MPKTRIIGVAGGSGSGKTTFARALHEKLGLKKSVILYQDHYYIDQSHRFDRDGGSVNFDHPSALDFALLSAHLILLKSGKNIEVPQYDFATHKRSQRSVSMNALPFIIVDGTLILSQPSIVKELDFSIFVETPEAERFERRLKRDIEERGRSPEGVKAQFTKQVKPMHDEFVEPSKHQADLILSGVRKIEETLLKAFKVFDL